ncbi:hypothetical protein Pr1d_07690 [Bythopirellula goksoeyrii]|uniref:Uncharacterized protein n=2 Tax=Bythopirellula goksoeyrii TaxID=1400387 RepID=A0A5B9Q7G1_9BACT|nr:hypothetical protein Pr1d_07690 [Bythopirellula goksoeyrii]
MLWIGIFDDSDQREAMRYFRRQLNPVLEKLEARLQAQPYDHVLREEKREQGAFEQVAEYIARNPERSGLVRSDGYTDYSYSGCLVPGYPELKPFQEDYWDRFWRIHAHLLTYGLHVGGRKESDD